MYTSTIISKDQSIFINAIFAFRGQLEKLLNSAHCDPTISDFLCWALWFPAGLCQSSMFLFPQA